VSPTLTVRVYYEDTDAGGVVYHASYLRFAERGRSEWLRSLGLDHRSLRERHGRQIVVRRCRVDFRRPAKLDDCLSVSTQLVDFSGARVHLMQRVERAGALLVELDVELAVVDLEGRPSRPPEPLRAALEGQRAPSRDA
jgi:acyl-CoA thioester hydrolase